MATIKDVAAKAGVSISTVSFVLNGKAKEKKVAEDTCKKVLAAAAALGYRPNTAAQRLRSAREDKPVIDFYWPMDDRTSYLSVILNGFRTEIEQLEFHCDLIIKTYKNDHLCEEKELCDRFQYSAAIIGAASAADMEYLEGLDPSLPIILFNRETSRHQSIVADEARAVREASLLFKSKGFQSASVFCGDHSYIASDQRFRLLRQQLEQAGVKLHQDAVFHTEDSHRGGIAASRSFLRLQDRPPVIITMTDTIALGASYYLTRHGISLPADLELLSFAIGDPDAAKYANPSISVLEMPTREMAKNAIDLAYQMIHAPSSVKDRHARRVETALFLRETCPE